MPARTATRSDKRSFGRKVGHELLKRHGKRPYYSPAQVRSSVDYLGYQADWSCWAMAIFTSPGDFLADHAARGQVCDLAPMKAEMVAAMTDGASASWFDVDLSWLDWPDVDLSGLFDFFDWS